MQQTVDKRSVFPFFNGDRVLVILAPDHRDAPLNRRNNTPLWRIDTQSADGETLATRYEHRTTSELLWLTVSDALYQSISSNEVDRRTSEIKAWINEVYLAYQARLSANA